jgi:hypothetical protein
MARGRMLSKTWGSSRRSHEVAERLGELGEFAQALFPLLVSNADDFGRLQGDAFTVKHQCFPISRRSVAEFEQALTAMHATGLIARWEVDGHVIVEIEQFDEHQNGLHKRVRSKFPGKPGTITDAPESPRNLPLIPSEEKRTEENGTEGNKTVSSEPEPCSKPADDSPAILTFETAGHVRSWALTQRQVDEWRGLYPGLDVRAEAQKALAWVRADPGRRKTAKGMPKFLVNWFNRSQNSGRARAVSAPPARGGVQAQNERDLRNGYQQHAEHFDIDLKIAN